MTCDCDCHKLKDKSDLKKCQDQNKRRLKELNEVKKKLLIATLIIVACGSVIGKQSLDSILDYFKTFDKVKRTIDGVGYSPTFDDDYIFTPRGAISPSPSTLLIFALAATPTPRRR
jgi:hypothetical protein